MKYGALVSVLAGLSLSMVALADPISTKLPGALHCKGVTRAVGNASETDVTAYGQMDIRNLASERGPVWNDQPGRLSESDNKLIIDFNESDQSSFFTFRMDDIKSIVSGRFKAIRGTYEDGFDWANGYNTRDLVVVECHL